MTPSDGHFQTSTSCHDPQQENAYAAGTALRPRACSSTYPPSHTQHQCGCQEKAVMFPGCEAIKCWRLRRKKQTRNKRRENSLAAMAASCAERSRGQQRARTNAHTHSPAGTRVLWDQLRAQGMCAHTCACTPWQGRDPCDAAGQRGWVGSGVQTQLCTPTAPLGSRRSGLRARWTPCTGASDGVKGNLQILVLEPSQNKLGNKRGFPCSVCATSTNLCLGLLPSLLSCCASCSSPPLLSSLTASAPTSWLLHTPHRHTGDNPSPRMLQLLARGKSSLGKTKA